MRKPDVRSFARDLMGDPGLMTSLGEKGLALGPQNILSSELHPLNFLQAVDKDLWNLVLKCTCHTNESENKILRWMFI